MKLKSIGIIAYLTLPLAAVPQVAEAWGHLGHQTLATIGSQLVPHNGLFWSANSTTIGVLTNVPDDAWKKGPNVQDEKPNHWFQPDSYYSNSNQFDLFPHAYKDALQTYSAQTLTTNGTAPWRVRQLYDMALAALKAGDLVTGLQLAGTMSHYIGDLSQPLHVTKDYDGQETGDVGIHKFFETDNINHANGSQLITDVTAATKKLLADPAFTAQFKGTIEDVVFAEINRAYAYKDEIIATDRKLGRSGQGATTLLALAKPRLSDGAATVAMIFDRLGRESGLANTGVSLSNVAMPAWVAPQFEIVSATLNDPPQSLTAYLDADDCDR
ncbi:MAG: hypothetical protein ABIR96_05720 [Bdellovibrionota bacterium]